MVSAVLSQLKLLLASLAAVVTMLVAAQAASPQLDSIIQNIKASSATSDNWSGYTSTGGVYTSVTGTWIIPNTTANGRTSADVTWVGIGGIKTDDLIQAGTQNVLDPSGSASTTAFYETLPNRSRTIPLKVKAGDSVTVSITQQSSGQWTLVFNDNSSGKNDQITLPYHSSLSSAEWIEEAPSTLRGILPLDNFGQVVFSGGWTTENGNLVTISGSHAQAVTMMNFNGQNLSTPSALGSDGASFTVVRTTGTSSLPVLDNIHNPGGFRGQRPAIGAYHPAPNGNGWFWYWVRPTPLPRAP